MVPQTRANISICLVDHRYQAPYQNGTPKVARKAFNIGKVWNPVCCDGDKTVEFVLWSTFSRIFLQRINISDTNWPRYLSSSYIFYIFYIYIYFTLFTSFFINIWSRVWRHQWVNLHILKTRISLERREIFQISKQHFASYTNYFFVF